MQVSKISNKLYQTCEWIWRLAYVNLLWMFATLAGLVVFGLLPATVAMFAVLSKWVMKEPNIPIFPTFISTYKKEFIKVNVLGLIFAVVGYIIYFNHIFLGTVDGTMHTVLLAGLFCTVFIYLITLFFIFPVYVHYDLKLFQYIKVASVIGIINPLAMITLVLSLALLYHLFYFIPGLVPFFSVSMTGLVIMWCASTTFSRIEKKQEKISCKEGSLG
ncbi:Uncharacterized membrane protein YesL [Anaerovirgula multivorans]|uniref:Uncharacterized membrane protein YesL n=1 Tax=Anaerovirgula multivorans TaxID=312168 RepID=A0A239H085_9FIRM|nr:YesL family protein [Anaerovirgula multivorans]SNS74203.1 Uncharacterized membrane protein YesL [Anaerovirgula multivorans]